MAKKAAVPAPAKTNGKKVGNGNGAKKMPASAASQAPVAPIDVTFEYRQDTMNRRCPFCPKATASYADDAVLLNGKLIGRGCGYKACRANAKRDALAGKVWMTD